LDVADGPKLMLPLWAELSKSGNRQRRKEMSEKAQGYRFSIEDDINGFYRSHGYVVLKDLFEPEEIEGIYDDILKLIGIRFGPGRAISNFLSSYSQDNLIWKACAKQFQNSLPNLHAGTKPAITELLRTLGMAEPIACVLPEIRIDMPGDSQYRQLWHQDWRSGQGSLNAVTIWVPLHDVTADHGAIELIPGSHLQGYRPVEVIENPTRYLLKELPEQSTSKITASLSRGECILFSQFLLHQSGENISGSPRMTSQFRFADRCDPAFIANNYRIPVSTELVWENPPTARDIAMVFGRD
jgi:ectoine hydroxylase-related dioxygenase (phytanoyl-CoA dioxygenase family)